MDVVRMDYEARGVIVKDAEGLRCPQCGLEAFTSPQARALEKIIYSLAPPIRLTRKISSAAGKKPVVYLPAELLEAVGARIGDKMELCVAGPGRILMELASAEDVVVNASDFPSKKPALRTIAPA
ncbi:hypothetical protein HY572_01665 [Candidatus Micrarchaeota archaeon]|nr:hypothetical protein [Candidatus Micrarchaeota archaeon]